jgi:hypothetical protein
VKLGSVVVGFGLVNSRRNNDFASNHHLLPGSW